MPSPNECLRMNKLEGKPRLKSGRIRTHSTSVTVSKTPTNRRSLSSSSATTESPPSNCATISRTSSSATVSQLSDNTNNGRSTKKSPSYSNLNRTSITNRSGHTTPSSEVGNDEQSDTKTNKLLRMPERRTDKTFIYMYDEKEKTSKEIIVPNNLHVTLPVLVQYEITKDTIRQVTDAAATKGGAACAETDPKMMSDNDVYSNSQYVIPTAERLVSNEEDEMKNKGARIMQWLLEVQCD